MSQSLPGKVRHFQNQLHRKKGSDWRPKVTLIVAFYNKINFFELVFASIERQTLTDFELIICDDGSRSEIVDELHKLIEQSSIAVRHIWHSDRGFCKNECLNRGVMVAGSEYLVFIDADCILHPEFLQDHFSNRKENSVLAGRRMDLIPWVSKRLTAEKIKEGFLQKHLWWILPMGLWMKDNNGTKAIRLSGGSFKKFLLKFFNRKPRNIVGCNFSLFKTDLEKVNGFDMSYTEVSFGEDSDVETRLRMVNVVINPFCHLGIQYHIYHRVLPRSDKSREKWLKVQAEGPAITVHGLRQLSEDTVYLE